MKRAHDLLTKTRAKYGLGTLETRKDRGVSRQEYVKKLREDMSRLPVHSRTTDKTSPPQRIGKEERKDRPCDDEVTAKAA